jgi:hypothetical protein
VQVFSLERWLQIFFKLAAIDDLEHGSCTAAADGSKRLLKDVQSASIVHQVRHLVTIRLVNQVFSRPRRCPATARHLKPDVNVL